MRAILLDTNAYTAFMRGESRIVEVIAHAPKLFVSSTVLGELLGGFAAGTREAKNRAELAQFASGEYLPRHSRHGRQLRAGLRQFAPKGPANSQQ